MLYLSEYFLHFVGFESQWAVMTASLLLGDRIDQYTFTCQKLLLIGTTVDTVTVLTLIKALTIINKAEVRIRWYL